MSTAESQVFRSRRVLPKAWVAILASVALACADGNLPSGNAEVEDSPRQVQVSMETRVRLELEDPRSMALRHSNLLEEFHDRVKALRAKNGRRLNRREFCGLLEAFVLGKWDQGLPFRGWEDLPERINDHHQRWWFAGCD